MNRYSNHKTVAIMPDTHARLKQVLDSMRSVDRRVSTFDAVINELVDVYYFSRSLNKVDEVCNSEDQRDGTY